MTRLPIPAALALAAIALAFPAQAEVTITATGPVVDLSVTETVTADPDIANLSAGVTSFAPTAIEALRLNSGQMDAVIRRIESLGVDEDDIQTSGISLNAEYDYDQESRQQVFRGYRVSNRVSVKLRDIERTGRVLDALVEAGATDLGGISWSIDDPSAAEDQAREAAFKSARERALGYARAAGYSDVRLLEVNESVTGGWPIPLESVDAAASVRNESMPIRPGQVQAGVTVRVIYEMTR
ncbi:MAG TPA: SIMPL domain-containing protein [Sphingomonadaceae bacterium]|nr:SIMPL domain-containing protein [Sphingomonadaceae bacterium]